MTFSLPLDQQSHNRQSTTNSPKHILRVDLLRRAEECGYTRARAREARNGQRRERHRAGSRKEWRRACCCRHGHQANADGLVSSSGDWWSTWLSAADWGCWCGSVGDERDLWNNDLRCHNGDSGACGDGLCKADRGHWCWRSGRHLMGYLSDGHRGSWCRGDDHSGSRRRRWRGHQRDGAGDIGADAWVLRHEISANACEVRQCGLGVCVVV